MLILDFKTMGGGVIAAFLPGPDSQQIIIMLQKSRALIWVRGLSPAARYASSADWSSFGSFLPTIVGSSFKMHFMKLCLFTIQFYWD